MEKIVNCILLVDDDQHDNFFHKRVITKSKMARHVRVALDGVEALEYLKNEGGFSDRADNPRPNIIFLDINMPRMNGFEFLEQYHQLDEIDKAEICVVMLTTSRNPDDVKQAETISGISDFMVKPLKQELLMGVVDEYFDIVNPS